MKCIDCGRLERIENTKYGICIYIKKFIKDTYYAPNNEFSIEDINEFGCIHFKNKKDK